jgi:hypothetical protein
MAVSELKLYGSGEVLFRKNPLLTSNYIWVLVKSNYTPSQAHTQYSDISTYICDTAGYAHVDATGKAFINTHDPDFADVAFAVGSEAKYVVLCTKTGGVPDKLVGFYDVEVGGNADVIFNTAFVLNAGGALDYSIDGWTYGGGGGGGGGGPPPEGAVTEVTITQPLRAGTPSSYPLNFCVPYAKGVLSSNSTFALYENGVKKRAQFHKFENWEDTSVKMLHVCTDASFDTQKTYIVKSGDTQNFSNAATITQNAGVTTVNFNGADYVTNDVTFSFMNGFRIYALNALDSLEYLSVNATTTVVENGEIRAVLRSEGQLRNGATILMHFILRQYFYPISGTVEIECTVESRNQESNYNSNTSVVHGGTRAIKISVSELGIKNSGSYNQLWAQGSSQDHAITSNSEMKIFQSATHIKNGTVQQPYVFSYSGIGTGTKASGAFQVTKTAGEKRSVFYKDFWKQYPSEISAAQTGLKIKFHSTGGLPPDTQWPSMAGTSEYKVPNTFYSPGYGIGKTYKIMLSTSDKGDTETKKINDIYQMQEYFPLAAATLDYMRFTKVFGDYKLASAASAQYDARQENNINVSFWNFLDGATDKWQVQYGWRFFGNRLHSPQQMTVNQTNHAGNSAWVGGYYNGSHFGGDKYILHWLRTGSEKWFYFASIETQNFSDLCICHAPRKDYDQWILPATNTLIDFPAGEVMAISHDNLDVYIRNYTGSHFSLGSMCTLYLLNKNYRYKEVTEKVMAWQATLIENWFPKNNYVGHGELTEPLQRPMQEAERERGNELMNACKAMHYLNKPSIWDDCIIKMVNYLILWMKKETTHWVKSVNVGKHSWTTGDAYWWMDWGANAYPYNPQHTGCNPWMAAIILGGMAQANDLAVRFNKTLPADFYLMANKACTYLMQWGRNGSGQWLYVEAFPAVDKAHNLAWPLAYWGNYFNNSTWFNAGLAIHQGTITMTGTNPYFYGYENILWPEEFKIFNT